MADIGPSIPITNTIDLPFSSLSLRPLTLTIEDRLNMGRNTRHFPSKLEFVLQFNKDNHPIVRSRLVDARCIILLPFLEVTSLTNPKEEDKVTFMSKLHWIDNDIRLTPMCPD